MPERFTLWQLFTRWFADRFCGWYLLRCEADARNKGWRDGQHETYKKFSPDNNGYWPWQDSHIPHRIGKKGWAVSSDSSGVYLVNDGFRVAKFGTLKYAEHVYEKLDMDEAEPYAVTMTKLARTQQTQQQAEATDGGEGQC